jgi:hypothetical protein
MLKNKTAVELYEHVKDLPIIDQVLMGSPETDEDADSEA